MGLNSGPWFPCALIIETIMNIFCVLIFGPGLSWNCLSRQFISFHHVLAPTHAHTNFEFLPVQNFEPGPNLMNLILIQLKSGPLESSNRSTEAIHNLVS